MSDGLDDTRLQSALSCDSTRSRERSRRCDSRSLDVSDTSSVHSRSPSTSITMVSNGRTVRYHMSKVSFERRKQAELYIRTPRGRLDESVARRRTPPACTRDLFHFYHDGEWWKKCPKGLLKVWLRYKELLAVAGTISTLWQSLARRLGYEPEDERIGTIYINFLIQK